MKDKRLPAFLLVVAVVFEIMYHVDGAWPDCVVDATDFTGDDLIAGLRFSNNDCARWCFTLGTRCNRWVYKERETWCHIKYMAGEEGNLTNPLTDEDKIKVDADSSSQTNTSTSTSGSNYISVNATDSGSTNATNTSSGRRKRNTK